MFDKYFIKNDFVHTFIIDSPDSDNRIQGQNNCLNMYYRGIIIIFHIDSDEGLFYSVCCLSKTKNNTTTNTNQKKLANKISNIFNLEVHRRRNA